MPRRALIAVLAAALALAAAGPAAAAPPFPSKIQLPSGWAPEGITAGAGTTIYVGSLAGGAVWAGDVRTGDGDVLVPAWGGAAVGVEYEADANRLWVAGGPTGTVRVYDATSGDLLRAYSFGPAGAVFLNDLVVTDDAVYVTDSLNPWLDVIPLGPDDALPAVGDVTTLPLDGITFEAGNNANGIVAARGWLIVVDSNIGGLFRVDPATGDATEMSTGGVSVTARGRPRAAWQHAIRRPQPGSPGRGVPARSGPGFGRAAWHPPAGGLPARAPERPDDGCRAGRPAVGRQRALRDHDDRLLGDPAPHEPVAGSVGRVVRLRTSRPQVYAPGPRTPARRERWRTIDETTAARPAGRPRDAAPDGSAGKRDHLRPARRRRAPLRRLHDLLRPGRSGLVQLLRHAAQPDRLPDRGPLHLQHRQRRRARGQ